MDNYKMISIRRHVANNLRLWMKSNPELTSQLKLSKKSGVAQSHIGRLLREESAATIDMLDLIARAFRRKPEDLLKPADTGSGGNVANLYAQELESPPYTTTVIKNLLDTASRMSSDGQHVLLGRAEELALQYPKKKVNRAN